MRYALLLVLLAGCRTNRPERLPIDRTIPPLAPVVAKAPPAPVAPAPKPEYPVPPSGLDRHAAATKGNVSGADAARIIQMKQGQLTSSERKWENGDEILYLRYADGSSARVAHSFTEYRPTGMK